MGCECISLVLMKPDRCLSETIEMRGSLQRLRVQSVSMRKLRTKDWVAHNRIEINSKYTHLAFSTARVCTP